MAHTEMRPEPLPKRVVILGGGFGGLSAAQALARAHVSVTLIDRHNYHLFQPLLYQVATAGLSPADIASPIRSILGRQKNARVMLAKVNTCNSCRAKYPKLSTWPLTVRMILGAVTFPFAVATTWSRPGSMRSTGEFSNISTCRASPAPTPRT